VYFYAIGLQYFLFIVTFTVCNYAAVIETLVIMPQFDFSKFQWS